VVNGAGGVTGRLLVSLAVLMDARVIAVTRPTSEQQLLSVGAALVTGFRRLLEPGLRVSQLRRPA
jgi:NADPH:quinone reductase-like Zn-dependent oxidoreductase